MKALTYLFLFLVFPGFLFSATMGLVAGWIDRKVTARLQWRVGPPWHQNFVDVIKLIFYKETLVSSGVSRSIFLGMPLLALSGATLLSTIVCVINAVPQKSFIGDLIVVVYLMMIPALALMLGGFVSANSLASLGSSREMKLMLSYELPFILALIVPVMKAGYTIRLGEIILYQRMHGPFIESISGILAFAVMLISIHAKLGFVPFDMPEAETELMSGSMIEYSGKALGIFKLAKAVMIFALPFFLVVLFFGGMKPGLSGVVRGILSYVLILVLMILIKNTNPRVRIDHAVRFFWGPVMLVAIAAVLLTHMGY